MTLATARRLALRGAAALGLTLALAWAVVAVAVRTDGVVDLSRFDRAEDARVVLDRHGAPLRVMRAAGVDRRWVPLRSVSPALVAAVLAVEDARFFSHDGVDLVAMGRAALSVVGMRPRLSGGSTLTQQLVKQVYGRPHGVRSKPMEVLRAMALERRMGKDEILEQYLNRLPFGNGIEGVARASEAYLGRDVATLTAGEAALLAGIPQAPSRYEPWRHRAAALRRRSVVLQRMAAVGAVSRGALPTLLREAPATLSTAPHPYLAPRFAERAFAQRRRGDGGAVRSSLDAAIQRAAEAELRRTVERFRERGARNAAAVVVANDTGEVLAYVGALDGVGGSIDLLRARRAPGSSLKPFVYERWFERGGAPTDVLADVTVPRTGGRGETFEARDYDGRERGPVVADRALSASLNLAALDAAARVGADDLVRHLRAVGFGLPRSAESYGAAIVLGGADVSPLELARAWVALSRRGTLPPLAFTPGVEGRGARVMEPEAAEQVWSALADPALRRAGFGDDLTTIGPHAPFALKTGTSSQWRDAWSAAATRRHTVVVWVGDPWGAPMASVSGYEAAAPTAVRVLAAAERMSDARAPTLPEVRFVEATVCAWSGLRAGPSCPHVTVGRFAHDHALPARCDAHDLDGAELVDARFARWVATQHPPNVRVRAPTTAATTLAVVEPRDGARLLLDPRQASPSLPLRATRDDVTWEVDGRPYDGARWSPSVGAHRIVAVHGRERSAPTTVLVASAL
ncbi:MAG: transglycosylase domain-containing protein [Polyangiales bacterium]